MSILLKARRLKTTVVVSYLLFRNGPWLMRTHFPMPGKGLDGQNHTWNHVNRIPWAPTLGLQHCLHYRRRDNLCKVLCLSQTRSYNTPHHSKNNVEDLQFDSWRWSLSYYQIFHVGPFGRVTVAIARGANLMKKSSLLNVHPATRASDWV